MHFSKSHQVSKWAVINAPCFNRIDFVVIPSYIELPCLGQTRIFEGIIH